MFGFHGFYEGLGIFLCEEGCSGSSERKKVIHVLVSTLIPSHVGNRSPSSAVKLMCPILIVVTPVFKSLLSCT